MKKIDDWGRVIFDDESLIELLYQGLDISKLNIVSTSEIEKYNDLCIIWDKQTHVVPKIISPTNTPEQEHQKRTQKWFIPEPFDKLPVRKILLAMCQTDLQRDRVNEEMDVYEKKNLEPLLRLMFALVDHFRKNDIVWGVGRGSSAASYCLFLIGVHKIDSLFFGLSFDEFIKS